MDVLDLPPRLAVLGCMGSDTPLEMRPGLQHGLAGGLAAAAAYQPLLVGLTVACNGGIVQDDAPGMGFCPREAARHSPSASLHSSGPLPATNAPIGPRPAPCALDLGYRYTCPIFTGTCRHLSHNRRAPGTRMNKSVAVHPRVYRATDNATMLLRYIGKAGAEAWC